MNIEKITPQIAAMYLGQMCDRNWLISKIGDWYGPINYNIIYWLDDGGLEITPHLRRLDSITEEDAREVYNVESGKRWVSEFGECSCLEFYFQATYFYDDKLEVKKRLVGNPAAWIYLLGKGFDLFDLIPAGLAKDVSNGKAI